MSAGALRGGHGGAPAVATGVDVLGGWGGSRGDGWSLERIGESGPGKGPTSGAPEAPGARAAAVTGASSAGAASPFGAGSFLTKDGTSGLDHNRAAISSTCSLLFPRADSSAAWWFSGVRRGP